MARTFSPIAQPMTQGSISRGATEAYHQLQNAGGYGNSQPAMMSAPPVPGSSYTGSQGYHTTQMVGEEGGGSAGAPNPHGGGGGAYDSLHSGGGTLNNATTTMVGEEGGGSGGYTPTQTPAGGTGAGYMTTQMVGEEGGGSGGYVPNTDSEGRHPMEPGYQSSGPGTSREGYPGATSPFQLVNPYGGGGYVSPTDTETDPGTSPNYGGVGSPYHKLHGGEEGAGGATSPTPSAPPGTYDSLHGGGGGGAGGGTQPTAAGAPPLPGAAQVNYGSPQPAGGENPYQYDNWTPPTQTLDQKMSDPRYAAGIAENEAGRAAHNARIEQERGDQRAAAIAEHGDPNALNPGGPMGRQGLGSRASGDAREMSIRSNYGPQASNLYGTQERQDMVESGIVNGRSTRGYRAQQNPAQGGGIQGSDIPNVEWWQNAGYQSDPNAGQPTGADAFNRNNPVNVEQQIARQQGSGTYTPGAAEVNYGGPTSNTEGTNATQHGGTPANRMVGAQQNYSFGKQAPNTDKGGVRAGYQAPYGSQLAAEANQGANTIMAGSGLTGGGGSGPAAAGSTLSGGTGSSLSGTRRAPQVGETPGTSVINPIDGTVITDPIGGVGSVYNLNQGGSNWGGTKNQDAYLSQLGQMFNTMMGYGTPDSGRNFSGMDPSDPAYSAAAAGNDIGSLLANAYQQAFDANKGREGEIRGRYENMEETLLPWLSQQLQGINQGYADRTNTGMGMLEGYGDQMLKDIRDRGAIATGSAEQEAIRRGLGNTTVRQGMLNSVDRTTNDALAAAQDRIAQTQFGAYSGLTGDQLAAQQNTTGMEYGANREMPQAYTDFIERITDMYPDMAKYLQLGLEAGKGLGENQFPPIYNNVFGGGYPTGGGGTPPVVPPPPGGGGDDPPPDDGDDPGGGDTGGPYTYTGPSSSTTTNTYNYGGDQNSYQGGNQYQGGDQYGGNTGGPTVQQGTDGQGNTVYIMPNGNQIPASGATIVIGYDGRQYLQPEGDSGNMYPIDQGTPTGDGDGGGTTPTGDNTDPNATPTPTNVETGSGAVGVDTTGADIPEGTVPPMTEVTDGVSGYEVPSTPPDPNKPVVEAGGDREYDFERAEQDRRTEAWDRMSHGEQQRIVDQWRADPANQGKPLPPKHELLGWGAERGYHQELQQARNQRDLEAEIEAYREKFRQDWLRRQAASRLQG